MLSLVGIGCATLRHFNEALRQAISFALNKSQHSDFVHEMRVLCRH